MIFRFGTRFSGEAIGASDAKHIVAGTTRSMSPKETKVEATTNRYLPNNETLDQQGVIDELIPKSDEGQLKIFRSMYKTDAVGGPAIDMISSITWSDGTLGGIQDKKVLEPFEEAFHMIDPQTFMPQLTKSYLTDGKIVASLIYDAGKGTFTDIIPQDPQYLEIIPIPVRGFDPKINYKGNSAMKKFLSSTDPRDMLAKSRISGGLAQKLSDGGKAPLEPLNTLYVPRVTSPYDWTGTSMLWRLVPFYAVEKALWNATISSARRRARSITHIKVGVQDYWEPTAADLDNIVNLFMQSEEDPVGAYVVTRDGVETQDVRTAQDFWRLSEEWDMLTNGKMRALGLSEALMSGDTTINAMDQAMSLFIENIKVLRAELTNRIFYRKIFMNIARAHGFVRRSSAELAHGIRNGSSSSIIKRAERDFNNIATHIVTSSVNGAGAYTTRANLTIDQAMDLAFKDLLIPEISWKKTLSPTSDDAFMNMLTTLEEKGIPISKKQWAAAGGFDLQKQIDGIEEDLAMQKLIQDKLGKKSNDDGETEEGEGEEESKGGDFGWAGASTVTGVTEVFDNVGKNSTFFGVGPNRLRKAVKALTRDKRWERLNSPVQVRKVLASLFDSDTTKIEAAIYLLNRAVITDLKIDKTFLDKVSSRLQAKVTASTGKIPKNLIFERNFLYAEYAKHNKIKKEIRIPRFNPDNLRGSRIYSGI